MSETVLVALISAGGALIAGLTSVGLNVFWMAGSFDQLRASMGDMRTGISDMRSNFNKRFERIDVRLDCVEEGLKHFYRLISEPSTDIARLKDKTDTN